MKICIAAVGKLKEKYLKEGVAEYSKRLSRFCTLEIMEVPDAKAPEKLSAAQEEEVKALEAENLLKRINDNSVRIALDISGEKLDSEGFAHKLQSFFVSGRSDITFIIGGSLGLHEGLLKKADLRLSLSDMTFPHQLARLILLEQLFRAFKIIYGETYHK